MAPSSARPSLLQSGAHHAARQRAIADGPTCKFSCVSLTAAGIGTDCLARARALRAPRVSLRRLLMAASRWAS
eukprot:11183786-Lingulodinium_polyedra.AAC.1